jgi:hypothetical protein
MREYFENIYSNKLENLGEKRDEFLDVYYLLKLNQENINHIDK